MGIDERLDEFFTGFGGLKSFIAGTCVGGVLFFSTLWFTLAPNEIYVFDYNRDGKKDILVRNMAKQQYIFLGDGNDNYVFLKKER